MALVIRTWNVFHGNTDPPGRRAYLRQMIELVTRDRPDVVCLQELPVWSLTRLAAWSGMHAVGAVARRPLLRRGARALTGLHHGLLRSALTGEADAILTRGPPPTAARPSSGTRALRRIAQTVDLDGVTVVNFHIDGDAEQLERVLALAGDRAVVAGDTNLRGARGRRILAARSPAASTRSTSAGSRFSTVRAPGRSSDGRSTTASCPITPRSRRSSGDLRGGSRTVPGARAPGVSQRRHERSAAARGRRSGAQAWLTRDLEHGRSGMPYIEELLGLREQVRAGFAEVVRASPEQIALTDSTTRGCQIVIAGLGLAAGDEVVTTDEEHFGLLGPLHASGARVVVTPADEDACSPRSPPRTRLIAVSHVLWTTGRKLDIARLKEAGLPVLVDGAQSAGAIPPDLAGADYFTISAQKWLCAAEPTGGLYVREPEQLPVALPSYFAHDRARDGRLVHRERRRTAFRLRAGSPARSSRASSPRSPATRSGGTSGPRRWRRAAASCSSRSSRSSRRRAIRPLVSFRPAGDPGELVRSLDERGVIVRDIPGHGVVRASCGWWTSEDDLERLAEGVS